MRTASAASGVALRAIVSAHGGVPESAYAFDDDVADLLPYATLRDRRCGMPDILGPVIGIYEWQAAPLLVLVDGDRLVGQNHLPRIRRMVALRGNIPYLGVVAGGRLDVHVVGLNPGPGDKVDFAKHEIEASSQIPYIASARPDLKPMAATISSVVLTLLKDALKELTKCGLSQTDAISLAGRALFARFLADRDLPLGDHMVGQDSAVAFGTPEMARHTCHWLETNFNGNLLPLEDGILDRLPEKGFGVLIDIMRRAPGGQMSLGWQQRWDNLHFAHIPVGILSQVYEQYLRGHEIERQKKEGSYYTPAPIADLMVRATLQGIPFEERHKARFLDPAAGAGVFLITAFRHLVAERWRHDGVRPNTAVLRKILYDQIAGFDVNEAALRFAALGLYLVSIELDPEPEPISKLSFDDLRETVLLRPSTEETIQGRKRTVSLASLGSLGPGVPVSHNGRYDVVIGNPPWKTGVNLEGWDWVESKAQAIAAERIRPHANHPVAPSGHDLMALELDGPTSPTGPGSSRTAINGSPKPGRPASLLPNNALDLPFVWRAAEWARPGGQVAFALHGRLLFQQSEGMPAARDALFKAFDVTSVINGAALRNTRVWPQVSAPFCILFAKNQPAGRAAAMRFITPYEEPRLNKAGAFRLDAANSPIVRATDLIGDPLRLKTLFRGSELDLDIRTRISADNHPSLTDVVGRLGGFSGVGIQKLRKSSRTRKGQSLPGADASYLRGMPYLQAGPLKPFPDVRTMPRFQDDRVHDPRDIRIFRAPLLVVDKVARPLFDKSAKPQVRGFSAAVLKENIAYSENYYGYSMAEAVGAREVALYLAAILRSSFARWWFLITSGEYGFEREVVEKDTFDKLPVPQQAMQRDRDNRQSLGSWYERHVGKLDMDELDDRVASAYGLSAVDRMIIDDTLTYAFAERRSEEVMARALDIMPFLDGLRMEMGPWERDFDLDLPAVPTDPALSPTWRVVTLGGRKSTDKTRSPTVGFAGVLQAADESGSTEVYHRADDGRLWIGMLAEPRYWSFSQGLRSARHIAWNHIDFLMGDGIEQR